MNFKLNEDERKVLDIIHEFGVREAGPLAAEIDEQERFPLENRNRLAELGMMGICYPKEYGGSGIPMWLISPPSKNWPGTAPPPQSCCLTITLWDASPLWNSAPKSKKEGFFQTC